MEKRTCMSPDLRRNNDELSISDVRLGRPEYSASGRRSLSPGNRARGASTSQNSQQISERRGISDGTDLQELKRKLSDIDSTIAGISESTKQNEEENLDGTGRKGCDGVTANLADHHQPKRQHLQVNDTNASETSANIGSLNSSTFPSSSICNQLNTSHNSFVISSTCPASPTKITSPLSKSPPWARQKSNPETSRQEASTAHLEISSGQQETLSVSQHTSGGVLFEEISSEQWEELRRPPSLSRLLSQTTGLVQEVDTDDGSDGGSVHTPDTPPRPPARSHPLAGVTIVECETLRYAKQAEEQWKEEDEEELRSPQPVHGSSTVMEGPNERAFFFTSRPFANVLSSGRSCLSPMPEETAEEMEWEEPLVETASHRATVCEEMVSQEYLSASARAHSGTGEVVSEESLPAQIRIQTDDSNQRSVTTECLPASSRSRTEEPKISRNYSPDGLSVSPVSAENKVRSWSLPVKSRVQTDLSDTRIWNESLPTEPREGADRHKEKKSSESLPVSSRELANVGNENERDESPCENSTEKLDDISKESHMQNGHVSGFSSVAEITVSASLPNETRRHSFEDENIVTTFRQSLPNETRTKVGTTSSESLANEVREREPESTSAAKIRHSHPNSTRLGESTSVEATTLRYSLPNKTREREDDNSNEPFLNSSLRDNAVGISPNKTHERKCDHENKSLANEARKRSPEETTLAVVNQPSSCEDDESNNCELLDRTDDKTYDFSALRMKRKQAQLAKKARKEAHSSKASTPLKKIHQGQASPEVSHPEKMSSTDSSIVSRNIEHAEASPCTSRADCEKHSAGGGESKETKVPSQTDARLGPRLTAEILEDMETDQTWRTVLPRWSGSSPETVGEDVPECPALVTSLDKVELFVTETLVLTVEARGYPAPQARWIVKPFLSSRSHGTAATTPK